MDRYHLRHPSREATREEMERATAPFGNRISILDSLPGTLVVDSTEETLAAFRQANPDWDIAKPGFATIQPVEDDFDNLAVRLAHVAIRYARIGDVAPIDDLPATRYVVHCIPSIYDPDITGHSVVSATLDQIQGLRRFTPGTRDFATIFFDAADPAKEDSVRAVLPRGWLVQKVGTHRDPMPG